MLPEHIRSELRSIVGEQYCLDRQEALVAYSYDATPMQQALPDVVVMPRARKRCSRSCG